MAEKLTAEEMFENYQRGITGAAGKIAKGVQSTTKNQAELAIAGKDRMIQNFNQSMAEGRFEKGLKKAGHEKWKRNTLAKGASAIAAGVQANKEEMLKTFEHVANVGEMIKREVAQMPKGTLEDSVARARQAMVTAKKAWGKTS